MSKLICNGENHKKLRDFFKSEDTNICTIIAPIGCGKTTLWKEVTDELKLNTLLYDNENKKNIQTIKDEIKKSYGFNFFIETVVIIEDVEDDKQKYQILFDTFPKFKFVITCLIKYNPSNEKVYDEIILNIPSVNDIQVYMRESGYKYNKITIRDILKKTRNDMRQVFILLENSTIKESRDFYSNNVYEIVTDIFMSKRKNVDEKVIKCSNDIFSIPPMIHENYISFCNNKNIIKASLEICYGDIIHTYMYKNAEWDYIPYVICQSVLHPIIRCKYTMDTVFCFF